MRKKSISYPLRIPENMLRLAKLRSQLEKVDTSTSLKQLLNYGAQRYVLELVSEGKMSVSLASELLEESIYRIYEIAEELGIKLGATLDQAKKSSSIVRGS